MGRSQGLFGVVFGYFLGCRFRELSVCRVGAFDSPSASWIKVFVDLSKNDVWDIFLSFH